MRPLSARHCLRRPRPRPLRSLDSSADGASLCQQAEGNSELIDFQFTVVLSSVTSEDVTVSAPHEAARRQWDLTTAEVDVVKPRRDTGLRMTNPGIRRTTPNPTVMTNPLESNADKTDAEQKIADLLEQITQKIQAGESVDLVAVRGNIRNAPMRIQQLFPAMRVLNEIGEDAENSDGAGSQPSPDQVPATGILGDYRIVREIGRGGMGIVYEAEQISLGRRVALKVLPFASVLDSRQLQRFQNEARAAASLRHRNIVQVYAVGCERAVHFFAMEYIDGQSLGVVVRQLRRLQGRDAEEDRHAEQEPEIAGTVSYVTQSLLSGKQEAARRDQNALHEVHSAEELAESRNGPVENLPKQSKDRTADSTTASDSAHSGVDTDKSLQGREFFRTVAQTGNSSCGGTGPCAPDGCRSPRYKTIEPVAGRQGKPLDRRLRLGSYTNRRPHHTHRRHSGYAALHEPRAGAGRPPRFGSPHGYLFPGCDAL